MSIQALKRSNCESPNICLWKLGLLLPEPWIPKITSPTLQLYLDWINICPAVLRAKHSSPLVLSWYRFSVQVCVWGGDSFLGLLLCLYLQNCLIAIEHISSTHENHKAQPPSTAQPTAEESAHLIGWGLSSAARLCLYNFNITIYTYSHTIYY